MARLAPTKTVLRALFARSGNQCNFPGCTHELINHRHKFVGQVCHIEAANKGGERYNNESEDEYRRSYENLMLMCYAHHIETNDEKVYTVGILQKIKYKHEDKYEKNPFKIDESELEIISNEMIEFWSDLEIANKVEHKHLHSGMAIEVDSGTDVFELVDSIYKEIEGTREFYRYLSNDLRKLPEDLDKLLQDKGLSIDLLKGTFEYNKLIQNRNWEVLNLGAENSSQRLLIDFNHLLVFFYSEYLKVNSGNSHARKRLEEVKSRLISLAKTAVYYD